MVSEDLKNFLIDVLSSWEIIAVSAVVIAYILLVSYVARPRKYSIGHPAVKKPSKAGKAKKPAGKKDAGKED
jgi:hypothetical protein